MAVRKKHKGLGEAMAKKRASWGCDLGKAILKEHEDLLGT